VNKKNIRIKDIARTAGVSVGTVDRVLHNRGRVSESALAKVMAVLNEIDYKPNLIARTLGANRTYRIAAVIPNPEQDPYWAQTNSGIQQAQLEWAAYGIVVEPFFFDLYDKTSFSKVAQVIHRERPDAILIAPIFYHEALSFFELCKTTDIPCVLFNTNIKEIHPLSFIGQNLYQSGRVAADLIGLGTKEPGILAVLHVHEDLDNSVHLLEKERGFREYFQDKSHSGFEIKTLNLGNPEEKAFIESLESLLSDELLKGIFVTTSKSSFIVAQFLEKSGRKGLTFVGYDMLEENLRYLQSGVINFLIHQNPRRQASLGISLLANYLVFKKQIQETNLFPLEIITQYNLDSYLNSQILQTV
jgi:LacI family transcriptional regulator